LFLFGPGARRHAAPPAAVASSPRPTASTAAGLATPSPSVVPPAEEPSPGPVTAPDIPPIAAIGPSQVRPGRTAPVFVSFNLPDSGAAFDVTWTTGAISGWNWNAVSGHSVYQGGGSGHGTWFGRGPGWVELLFQT